MPSRFPEPSALEGIGGALGGGAGAGGGDPLERAAIRIGRYLKAQNRNGSGEPLVVTRHDVEAFWEVLWDVAAGVLFARMPEVRTPDNHHGVSASAALNTSTTSSVLGELRPSSSAYGRPPSSCSQFNTTHHHHSDAGGRQPPWLRIVLIPKVLAVLCRAAPAIRLDGHHPHLQRPPRATPADATTLEANSGWICLGDVSNEFATHFSFSHRASAQHIGLNEQRSVDVPMREVARLLSGAMMARRRRQGDNPAEMPVVTLSVDDVVAFGRIVAESIGESARHSLTSRVPSLGTTNNNNASVARSSVGCFRFPCGIFGSLRMANGSLEFVPHPQRSVSALASSSSTLIAAESPTLFALKALQPQQQHVGRGGGSRPPSSSGGKPLGLPLSRTDAAAVAPTRLQAVHQADATDLSRPTHRAIRPLTPSSFVDDAPENRKYLRPSAAGGNHLAASQVHRPGSSQGVLSSSLRLPECESSDMAHGGSATALRSSTPLNGAQLQYHHHRPASSSSIGPSASECAADAGHHHHVPSYHSALSQSMTTATSPHAAGVAHQLWRAQQRRARLDEELAEVQRALETRLGMASPAPLGARYSSHSSNGSCMNTNPLHDDDKNRDADAPSQQQRSATALAYHPVPADCTRQPSPSKLERVMALAIERHQASVKRRELEDARAAARRGHDDETALYARVVSEIMRREQAEKTREALLLQQKMRLNDVVLATAAGGGPTTSAPTCIMRPVDDRPFVSPAPGGPVASVTELGSDPSARLAEKRQQKNKKAAYLRELQEQVAVKHSSRTAEFDEKRAMERTLAAEDLRHSEQTRDRDKAKKREMRDHYVEAWDMQRTIAVSVSPS